MNIKENLTCKTCNKIYTDPVSLNCCGRYLCKKHIDETLNNQSINAQVCPFCDSEIQNQKCVVSQVLKNLIDESELHKFEISPEYVHILNDFKEKLNSIEHIYNNPESFIYHDISELKRQVDLDREYAKSEIDTLAEEILSKLNSFHDEFKNECSKESSYFGDLIKEMKNEMDEYEKVLKSFKFNDEDRLLKSLKIQKDATKLDFETKSYKNKLFKNKIIKYEPKNNGVFGKLVVTEREKKLLGHTRHVRALTFTKKGLLASGGCDKVIKVWNVDEEKVLFSLEGHQGGINSLLCTGEGFLVSASGDKTIKIWDLDERKLIKTLEGHSNFVRAVVCVGNEHLASGSDDKTVKLWNMKESRIIFSFQGHSECVYTLAYKENGFLASASFDKLVKIWDVERKVLFANLEGHVGDVFGLAYLENGYLASSSNDKTIRIWNVENQSLVSTLEGHTDGVSALVSLKKGYLASTSYDQSVKIWDTNVGREISSFEGHVGDVRAIAYKKNSCLVSGDVNSTIMIWDVGSIMKEET
jgi:WD40 repeat protein